MKQDVLKQHEIFQKEISDKIIYLPQNYLCNGTINPNNCLGKPEANAIEIKANVLGPICPEKYFSSDFRVLWLLKESYITKESFEEKEKPDRGGHYQAEDRCKEPLGDNGDNTYRRIIETTYLIVKNKNYKDIKNISECFDVFRHNTCILNVNDFPGLCGQGSTDSIIYEWAQINKEQLTKCIKLYKPNVIIGGNTLRHFFPEGSTGGNHNPRNIRSCVQEYGLRLFDYEILSENCLFMDEILKDIHNCNYAFWNDDICFIDAWHPACRTSDQNYCDGIKKCFDEVMKRRRKKIDCR